MKTSHRLIIFLFVIIVTPWSKASDNALTRDDALAILQGIRKDPITRKVNLVRLDPSLRRWDRDVNFVLAAAEEGFFVRKATDGGLVTFAITKKSKPFVIADGHGGRVTLRMADLTPAEVTGIGASSSRNGRTVQPVTFKYLFNPTPLGAAFERINDVRLFSGWATGGADIALHDNGWKLESWTRSHQ